MKHHVITNSSRGSNRSHSEKIMFRSAFTEIETQIINEDAILLSYIENMTAQLFLSDIAATEL